MVGNAAQCRFDGGTGAALLCHNASECGGHYCCGDFDGRTYQSVTCAVTCDPSDAGSRDRVRFCDPVKKSLDCPAGQTCTESTVLTGFLGLCWPGETRAPLSVLDGRGERLGGVHERRRHLER